MVKRYLEPMNEQVYGIYDQSESITRYVGRILVSEDMVMVYKEDMRMALTWNDIDLILSKRPKAGVR